MDRLGPQPRARTQGLGIALVVLTLIFALRGAGLRDTSTIWATYCVIFRFLASWQSARRLLSSAAASIFRSGPFYSSPALSSDDLIRLGEVHTAIAVPVVLGIGCVAGAINGLLITWLRISAFIVTLASLYIFRGVGLSLYRTDVQNLQAAIISDENFLIIGQNDVLGIPVSFIIFAVLLALGTFVLRRTGLDSTFMPWAAANWLLG